MTTNDFKPTKHYATIEQRDALRAVVDEANSRWVDGGWRCDCVIANTHLPKKAVCKKCDVYRPYNMRANGTRA